MPGGTFLSNTQPEALEGTPRSGRLHLRPPERWPGSAVSVLPSPTYPTPILFYCSFLIPGPVCEVPLHPALTWGSGTNSLFLCPKWDPTLLGVRAAAAELSHTSWSKGRDAALGVLEVTLLSWSRVTELVET